LAPQAQTVLSALIAKEWLVPALMAITPVRILVLTGVFRLVEVLSPNWPELFWPNAHTVLSDFRVRVKFRPVDTAMIPLKKLIFAGFEVQVLLPTPSWP
jgi:hypothetical protein